MQPLVLFVWALLYGDDYFFCFVFIHVLLRSSKVTASLID